MPGFTTSGGFGNKSGGFGSGSSGSGGGGFGTPSNQRSGFGSGGSGGGFGSGGSGGGGGSGGFGKTGGGFGNQGQQQQQQQTGLGVGGFGTPAQNRSGGFSGGGGGGFSGSGSNQAQQQQQQPSFTDPSRQSHAGKYLLRVDSIFNALDASCKYRTFCYNFCTPGQADQAIGRERLAAQQLGGGCTEEQWLAAKRDNPDPEAMYPVPVHFLVGLRDRVDHQKSEIAQYHKYADQILGKLDHLRALRDENDAKHQKLVLEQAMVERKLLTTTAQAEVLRQFGLQLGKERHAIADRTQELLARINAAGQFKAAIVDLQRNLEAEVQRFAKRASKSSAAGGGGGKAGAAGAARGGSGTQPTTGAAAGGSAGAATTATQPAAFGGVDSKKVRFGSTTTAAAPSADEVPAAGGGLKPTTQAMAVAFSREIDQQSLREWNRFLARMEEGIRKLKRTVHDDLDDVVTIKREVSSADVRHRTW